MTEPPETTLFDIAPVDEKSRARALPYGAVRDMEPLSRNWDPLPSYQAADGLKRSGVGGKQRFAVYMALR